MISLFDNETILRAYTKEKVSEAEAIGEARGKALGEASGKKQTAIEVARKMLLKKMSPDLISELSGLTLAEVNALQAGQSL